MKTVLVNVQIQLTISEFGDSAPQVINQLESIDTLLHKSELMDAKIHYSGISEADIIDATSEDDNEQKEYSSITLNFEFRNQKHELTFIPESGDDWQAFADEEGNGFDVNYDEDYNMIVVYEVRNNETLTQATIYKKSIK